MKNHAISMMMLAALLFISLLPPLASAMATPLSSSSIKKNYDLLVIGGGSAGLTAAKFAATFGNSVAIIEKARMGGDCTWTGCIPSKSLLASAKVAHALRKASDYGVLVEGKVSVDMKRVRERVRRNIDQVYNDADSPEALKKLGIDTIYGGAKFLDKNTLEVNDDDRRDNEGNGSQILHAKYGVLIATGAKPKKNTSIPGLDAINYITYEEVFDLDEVPDLVTIIGGGPIGAEISQALSRLGSTVTLITPRLLPKEEPKIGEALSDTFKKEGINIINSKLRSVESISGTDGAHLATCTNDEVVKGDIMFVATGRQPVVSGMGLSEIGIELNASGGISVNDNLESIKGVYAAGDCTGDEQYTHYAGYQGAVAARNILLPFNDPGVCVNVPSTIFTDPEIASVGMTEEAAKQALGEDAVQVAVIDVNNSDRGVCEDKGGLIQIVYRKKGYKILGATIMSPGAGEMIAEISVAMKTGLSFDMLATVMHTYPSYSFALQSMAAEVYYGKLIKLKRILKFLKKIGL